MDLSSIKEAFGTEPKYTKFIADNVDVATRLLEVVGMELEDDYKIISEDRTFDSKRVDLTIKDGDNKTVAVIEAQDAAGWLDSVHTSKILYYCYEKNCFNSGWREGRANEYECAKAIFTIKRFTHFNAHCKCFY